MPCLFLMCCAVVLSERCVPLRYFYGTDYLFYHFAQFVWKRVLSLAQASHSGFDMCISCGGKKAFSVKNVTPFLTEWCIRCQKDTLLGMRCFPRLYIRGQWFY